MRRQLYPSVVIGVCTNNKDPEGLGRIKVRFPWLEDSEESHWARVAQFMTGGGRGMWIIPEIGDEVLVAFEHGDIHFPYVLGSLWNGVDRPPAASGLNEDGQNNIRMFQSRAGHQIVFDDTPGGEMIHLHDASTKNSVDLYNFQNSIHFTAATGDIIISAPEGTITIETTTLETKSSQGTTVTVGKGYRLGVTGTSDMTAGAKMKWHTKTVAGIDVGATMALTAGGLLNMQSSKVTMAGDGSAKFKSGIVNLVAGIKYGLTATKMSLDTGLLGYLRGVEKLNVQANILASIRGLMLSMVTTHWKGAAPIISDIAGSKAEIKGATVYLNKKAPKAAPAMPGARPVKLWPPNVNSLKDFTKWAQENWNKLPDWARAPLEKELKAKLDDVIKKIDNPYLQAALGGALGSFMGGDLSAIAKAALEKSFEAAKKEGQAALDEWIKQNVPEGPLRTALTSAAQSGAQGVSLFGTNGVLEGAPPATPPPSSDTRPPPVGTPPPDDAPPGGGP